MSAKQGRLGIPFGEFVRRIGRPIDSWTGNPFKTAELHVDEKVLNTVCRGRADSVEKAPMQRKRALTEQLRESPLTFSVV